MLSASSARHLGRRARDRGRSHGCVPGAPAWCFELYAVAACIVRPPTTVRTTPMFLMSSGSASCGSRSRMTNWRGCPPASCGGAHPRRRRESPPATWSGCRSRPAGLRTACSSASCVPTRTRRRRTSPRRCAPTRRRSRSRCRRRAVAGRENRPLKPHHNPDGPDRPERTTRGGPLIVLPAPRCASRWAGKSPISGSSTNRRSVAASIRCALTAVWISRSTQLERLADPFLIGCRHVVRSLDRRAPCSPARQALGVVAGSSES